MTNELLDRQKDPQNELIDAGPRKVCTHDFKTNISRYLAELRAGYHGGIVLCRYKRPVAIIVRPSTRVEDLAKLAEREALIRARAMKRFATQKRMRMALLLAWRGPQG